MILQGHIGAVMQDGQYLRSRDVKLCDAFIRDFLTRFHTDYIDLGMMHFIDTEEDFRKSFHSPYIDYCLKLKHDGVIRHLGVFVPQRCHGEEDDRNRRDRRDPVLNQSGL